MKEANAYVRVELVAKAIQPLEEAGNSGLSSGTHCQVIRALEEAGLNDMTVIDVRAIWLGLRDNSLPDIRESPRNVP